MCDDRAMARLWRFVQRIRHPKHYYPEYNFLGWNKAFEIGKEEMQRGIQEIFLEIDEYRAGREIKDGDIENITDRFISLCSYIYFLKHPDPIAERRRMNM
jgi:hypothetical protein